MLVRLHQFDSVLAQIDEVLSLASRLKDGANKEYLLAAIKVDGATAHKQVHKEQPIPEKFLVDWIRLDFARASSRLKRIFPIVLQFKKP